MRAKKYSATVIAGAARRAFCRKKRITYTIFCDVARIQGKKETKKAQDSSDLALFMYLIV